MIRRGLRILAWALLWVTVTAGLAVTIVPRFLDRIYYRGPVSGHFDGQRFANPGADDTRRMPTGGSRGGFLWRQATGGDGRPPWPDRVAVRPSKPAPMVAGDAMIVTWIGHASVLVQSNGLNILTDPVWSDTAGPFGFGPARATAPGVAFDDLPRIDLIVVSHNHYDHMDLATLKRLWDRDRPLIVTSLGNDTILRGAGVQAVALDWGGSVPIGAGARVHVTRNHHWGSRWFTDRNRALWSSFVVSLPGGNLFFAGDTGFGDGRWPGEAARLGPIRLALIPIGAFRFEPGQMRTGSHIGPVEAVEVFRRLGAQTAIPIHWGTFRLSYEARDTPPRLMAAARDCYGIAPGRFASVDVGRSVAVPDVPQAGASPIAAPAPAALARCLDSPAVRALR